MYNVQGIPWLWRDDSIALNEIQKWGELALQQYENCYWLKEMVKEKWSCILLNNSKEEYGIFLNIQEKNAYINIARLYENEQRFLYMVAFQYLKIFLGIINLFNDHTFKCVENQTEFLREKFNNNLNFANEVVFEYVFTELYCKLDFSKECHDLSKYSEFEGCEQIYKLAKGDIFDFGEVDIPYELRVSPGSENKFSSLHQKRINQEFSKFPEEIIENIFNSLNYVVEVDIQSSKVLHKKVITEDLIENKISITGLNYNPYSLIDLVAYIYTRENISMVNRWKIIWIVRCIETRGVVKILKKYGFSYPECSLWPIDRLISVLWLFIRIDPEDTRGDIPILFETITRALDPKKLLGNNN